MELRHLRYFIALAEELHFGRAAERLNISQPPLSQQIKALEQELGVRLFERSSRQVQLTETGRLFLDEAKATLAQAERAYQIAGRAQRGEIGELRIGLFASSPLSVPISTALTTFRRTNPEVFLSLHERTTPQQIEDLEAGNLDLGFLRSPIAPSLPPTLQSMELVQEQLFVFFSADHHLAQEKGPIPIEQLSNESFVFFARDVRSTLHDQVYALCAAAGYSPRVSQEANTNLMIIGLVAAGLGISVLPAAQAHVNSDRVNVRPLDAPGATTAIWLANRHQESNPTVQWFIEHFSDLGIPVEESPPD